MLVLSILSELISVRHVRMVALEAHALGIPMEALPAKAKFVVKQYQYVKRNGGDIQLSSAPTDDEEEFDEGTGIRQDLRSECLTRQINTISSLRKSLSATLFLAS